MTNRPDNPNCTERTIFLQNLAALRKQHHLTQKQMAQTLGIGIHSWRMIERGIMPPMRSAFRRPDCSPKPHNPTKK